jgi:flagellin-specific chaperone FliS
LIAQRLRTPWQLIFLATKAAASRGAADVEKTPYAIVVSMVLDRIEDDLALLRTALRNNRVIVARDLLTEIYDIEHALHRRIDQLDQSAWGERLTSLMESIASLVEAEVARFPEEVGHVLASRSLRIHDSLAGKLAQLAWKGRDAVSSGAANIMKLINAA